MPKRRPEGRRKANWQRTCWCPAVIGHGGRHPCAPGYAWRWVRTPFQRRVAAASPPTPRHVYHVAQQARAALVTARCLLASSGRRARPTGHALRSGWRRGLRALHTACAGIGEDKTTHCACEARRARSACADAGRECSLPTAGRVPLAAPLKRKSSSPPLSKVAGVLSQLPPARGRRAPCAD